MPKKINNRKETTKIAKKLLKNHKHSPNYSSTLFAQDISNLLRKLIEDFEKLRFDLDSGNLELSPSQEAAYNKCHEIWNDDTISPIEQLENSFACLLIFLRECPSDCTGYSIAEASYLYRLSNYELLLAYKHLGLSDYGLIRGMRKLKKIGAVTEEEVEDVQKNAYKRIIEYKLNKLGFNEDQVAYVVKKVKTQRVGRGILTRIENNSFNTVYDLVSGEKIKK